jgi:hypothetical protein
MANKKITYVIIEAKTDKGKEKLGYHGDKWEYRGEVETLKFVRSQGPSIVVRSRDGKKILFIKKQDDPDLKYRIV